MNTRLTHLSLSSCVAFLAVFFVLVDSQLEIGLQQVSEYHPWICLFWIFWETWVQSLNFMNVAGTTGYTPTQPLALPSQYLQPRFFLPLSYPFYPILPLLFSVNCATRLGM